MCRLRNIAMRVWQTDRQTDRQADRQTDRRRTKWSLCVAMLRRWHNKTVGKALYSSLYPVYIQDVLLPYYMFGLWFLLISCSSVILLYTYLWFMLDVRFMVLVDILFGFKNVQHWFTTPSHSQPWTHSYNGDKTSCHTHLTWHCHNIKFWYALS